MILNKLEFVSNFSKSEIFKRNRSDIIKLSNLQVFEITPIEYFR